MSEVISANENNFTSEVENSTLPVLVEFGASWCGPCKRQLPILEGIAKEYSDKLKVVKIDIDDSPDVASKFHIRSVPTLMIFEGGNCVHLQAGLASAADIKSIFLSKVGI